MIALLLADGDWERILLDQPEDIHARSDRRFPVLRLRMHRLVS
jgi:hypothetical protein